MSASDNRSTGLRAILWLQTIALLVYTLYTVHNEGWGLFTVFTNDILTVDWNGQFNLDFSCYLLLSGLWIAWRDRFSAASIGIAVAATILGIIVFAPYVLHLLSVSRGDIQRVLLGSRTASF